MDDPRRLMIFLICGLLLLLVITAKQSRRHALQTSKKQCRQCGARFGTEAQYCGRCGRAF